MEIKNDKFEISKSSWVYKLLRFTGMTKWDEPDEACTLALMVGWRVVLATVLAIIFFWGWGFILFASSPTENALIIGIFFIAFLETLALILLGIACLVEYAGKRFEQCKRTCPRVRFVEEDNGRSNQD